MKAFDETMRKEIIYLRSLMGKTINKSKKELLGENVDNFLSYFFLSKANSKDVFFPIIE